MKVARDSARHVARLFALTAVTAGSYASPPSVQEDILQALRLEGHHCDEVTAVEHRAVADYIATCSNGARYQIEVTPGGRLLVQDLDSPQLTEVQKSDSHPELVKRSLTAVIHLADVTCGAVVSVVTLNPLEHLATCTNGMSYRVRASADGKVHVDEE